MAMQIIRQKSAAAVIGMGAMLVGCGSTTPGISAASVGATSGVTDAVAVSSDGLLMAMSSALERAGAEQLAAIIAGLTSLAESTAPAEHRAAAP